MMPENTHWILAPDGREVWYPTRDIDCGDEDRAFVVVRTSGAHADLCYCPDRVCRSLSAALTYIATLPPDDNTYEVYETPLEKPGAP